MNDSEISYSSFCYIFIVYNKTQFSMKTGSNNSKFTSVKANT
jgi:hypothetical protein